MSKKGKKYIAARKKIEREKHYPFSEAVKMALELSHVKFDETIDVAVRLGVDPRHADQMVRGTVVLPNGIGKDVKVLDFVKGEKEKEALDAGVDYIGNDETIEKIKKGWVGFDKAVATPDMMSSVGKIGRILGPRGLMPNAKTGTVTMEISRTVKELKAGKIDFRVEKTSIVHVPMGKVSFGVDKLCENAGAFFETLIKLKPSASKGIYLKNTAISTTMGPGIKVDTASIKDLSKSEA